MHSCSLFPILKSYCTDILFVMYTAVLMTCNFKLINLSIEPNQLATVWFDSLRETELGLVTISINHLGVAIVTIKRLIK